MLKSVASHSIMSDRVIDDLSDLQLVGGTIKLSERPSNSSQSSVTKKKYFSRFYSRPSSAMPRLCSGDHMQDDLPSIKNDHRPYSADFVMPTLLSGKSKETLTDGSFESIYVPVDFRLPSSNLFKELLEEDIEDWRNSDNKSSHNLNVDKKEEIKSDSIPLIIVSEPNDQGISNNLRSNEVKGLPEESSTESKANTMTSKIGEIGTENSIAIPNETAVEDHGSFVGNEELQNFAKEESLGTKYDLTPGLTSKPPLPKKTSYTILSSPSVLPEQDTVVHDNAIYDYFAIKYNFQSSDPNFFSDIAEKPICDETHEGISNHKDPNPHLKSFTKRSCRNDATENIMAEDLEQNTEITSQCIKTVEVFEEQKTDEDFDLNATLNSWLDEIGLNNVQQKESETDMYMQEVRKQCNREEVNENDPKCNVPFLSEIDIDNLFRFEKDQKFEDKIEKHHDIQSTSLPTPNKKNSKEWHKKNISRKTSKSKSPVSRKSQPAKVLSEKEVANDKVARENKTFSKAKFTAMPIKLNKLNKLNESPRHKAGIIEENIDTWIGEEVSERRRKRAEFTDLINRVEDLRSSYRYILDRVEDLRSTTEIVSKDVTLSCTPVPEDNKQENFDDLETIIEALEHQDKTSQNNIKTMKKIVTSELSNSMILNESEDNLLFKNERKRIEGDLGIDLSSYAAESLNPSNDKNNSELKSPVEFSTDSHCSTNDEKKNEKSSTCMNSKKYTENLEVLQNRPRCADSTTHMCGDFSKTRCAKGPHKYKDLLSYLDEVDKKCTKTLEVAKERAQTASKLVLESSNLFDTMPKVEDLLTHSSEELASYIIDLSLRVKDKTSCIGLLQNELTALREKVLSQSKEAESNLRQKLKEQKDETERITKRHQKFIDQLMEEKKTLARRCEELVEEMTVMEDKYISNMKAIEHKHHVEMQKMKDMQAASEKLRREKWIEGRTQKIKEMAVKSIEPEVERMEKRHQEELSNLRSVHKREIEELELRAARKLQEHSENLREQLIQDREKALSHERDVMRLRYEKLVESEERNYQEQRRRLLADHANRVAECEEREAQAAAEKERAIKQAQEEFEDKLQAAARRHANEMKLLKETAVIEMENWKNSFRKQQSTLLMEKETAIRRECKKERDREIEIVIERLENESNKAKTQIEQTTENRIKRIRDKYEAEIRDLEMLEKDAQNKYCEARSKLLEYEDVILTLRTSIKQLETQLTEENLKRSKLETEREEIRQAIRQEYEDKMHNLESEVEELRTSADKQVEKLYSRVRVSLARKDELLAELTNDHKALKEKCIYLENMMEQQRKEFMINS